jgi:RNA polymerase sigma-70 factor (ECF subfamily)
MTEATPPSSTTLLMRLRQFPSDQEAWNLFVARYGQVLYRWCRARGLQDADAQDVMQEVFRRVAVNVRQFDRSRGSPRNWLFAIFRNCLADCLGSPHLSRTERGGEAVRELLASEEARRDLEQQLGQEFDLEVFELAERGVRLRVEPNTWQSYWLTRRDGLSLADAAVRIGIPVGHVSRYANRVLQMLSEERKRLEEV